MSALTVLVYAGGAARQLISQGTGWLLAPDVLVTAFHVVGKLERRRFFHEGLPEVSYVAVIDEGGRREVALTPLCCDYYADVALLRAATPLPGPVLRLRESLEGASGTAWRARGYPRFMGGKPFTLSGRVTDLRGDTSNNALQLLVDQDTRATGAGAEAPWEGMSGSAIVGAEGDGAGGEGPVLGVLTQVTEGVATSWGAAVVAVGRLQGLRLADDLLARCQALLVRLYARPEPLLQQRQDLGWPEGPQTADRAAGTSSVESVASQLVARALLDGASGLLSLLREVQRDFPSQPEVTELSSAIEARLKLPARRSSPSRREIVDETLSELISSKNYGVALLSPLGFGARQLAHETLRRLDRSDKALLPVRLVPERGTTTDDHLYSALLRDLKSGLEEQLGTPLPPHWREPLERRGEAEARQRFSAAIEDLLRPNGPAARDHRKLVLAIEGLARVQTDQLRAWSLLLARFAQKGLRLLVWGGKELSDMRSLASEGSSAFHVLRGLEIGSLSETEVLELAATHGVSREAAATLHRESGGHPALIDELLAKSLDEVRAGDAATLRELMLTSDHLYTLRSIAEREDSVRERLRERARDSGASLKPKPSLDARLYWLGILRKVKARFDWLSPVMQSFAEEWL
ncbi:MAG TPA: serine protease [Pseudomonadota bacterium]|nr:serine protease [Pseudomonadota bacterium]